jgi:hypothetical protein
MMLKLLTISLLAAIAQVESGNNPDAVGDNGDSIGTYQIQRPYFKDAQEHNPTDLAKYTYESVTQDSVAIMVIESYWDRYATEKRLGHQATDEDKARIHNGGPNGYKKEATEKYWAKVQKAMEAE